MKRLEGKNIVLGVTGGIAAYKAVDLVSRLTKEGANVDVVMTKNAMEFVTPLTFQTISKNKVNTELFECLDHYDINHISLGKKADLLLICPATANILAKAAHGIADDLLSTTVLATHGPVMFVPAMNVAMYENQVTQDNIKRLKELGYSVMEPAEGTLACGDEGKGKLPPVEDILEEVVFTLYPKDLLGKKIIVTAGPTRERLDPVRFLSNRSTGKMGFEIAYAAALLGAEVTLVAGPVSLQTPPHVKRVDVESAEDMKNAVLKAFPKADVVIKSAAVGDFRPKNVSEHKIKKEKGATEEGMTLELTKNDDILKLLGQQKGNKILVGFAAESQHLEEYAKKKLEEKNLDMIVANNIIQKGAGFGTDTNIVKIFYRDGSLESLKKILKTELAFILLDRIKKRMEG